jgi:uncharacterized protein YndB with AHSA1/START domain
MLHAVEVSEDVATIYRAITTREGEASFWTSDCAVEAVVGFVARFGFPGAPVDLRMRIDALEQGRSVRWTCLGDFPFWADTIVRWDLEPSPSGTGSTVVFRQEGWPSEYPEIEYAKVNYTWGRIIGALKAYAETGTPQPFLG